MSKGSRRRISLIPEAELQRKWDKCFKKKKTKDKPHHVNVEIK